MKTFGPPSYQLETLRVVDSMWKIEGYKDRDGFDPNFMGDRLPLPSPRQGHWDNDLVELVPEAMSQGPDKSELKYRHFSVRMSKSRRSPLVSAVNIDGAASKREVPRTDIWRRDPRIPKSYQNLREAYGKEQEGFFSRGHMTRREDPNWGKDDDLLKESDADTFHVTNAAPQRQGFNAGIWLALEEYVLGNTDRENMRVCVLTGPILRENDPTYYNVKIPIEFWKIVAFVNGQTKLLTTIGYKRSQAKFLPKAQRSTFVFGDFQDTQVSIASLSEDTGLDLSDYVAHDVFEGAGEGFEVQVFSLSDFYLVR